jgi:multidrug efflux pump subunit AcrB
MNLPEFSIKKPAIVILLFLGLSAWGFYTYRTMSRREDPKIEISWAAILTIYPGASAAEVEKKVTKPIEEELESLSAIEEIHSDSKNNVSFIMLKVNYNTNFAQQWDLVRARIATIKGTLPASVDGPKLIDDFGDVVGMIISIHSKNKDPHVLKVLAKNLKAKLLAIPSVGKVVMKGEPTEEIQIVGKLDDFLNYEFGPIKAKQLLEAQNMGIPGGIYHTKINDYRIVPPNEFNTIKELKNQIFTVSPKTGEPLRIGQVFKVKKAYQKPQTTYTRTNGNSAFTLNVTMKDGFDITKMGKKVRKEIKIFSKTLPQGVSVELVHDQPVHVEENLGSFIENLMQSLVLVALAMALLLGISSSILVSLGLPLAILISIAFMPFVNVDLERASVAAFIIALGMLVDNSIIVIDHIHNLLDQGKDLSTACIRGAQDLIYPILGGTIASILAFFPLILLPDEMGAYIRSLPWVLTLSLGSSFFISVMVTPLLAFVFLRFRKKKNKKKGKTPKLSRGARFYKSLMSGSLKYWPIVVILAIGSFAGSLVLFKSLGLSFFPVAERDQFVVDIWTPEGSSITNTDIVAKKVEKILHEDKRVKSTLTSVGIGLDRFWIALQPYKNSFNLAQILVNTKSNKATNELVVELQRKLPKIPGARIVVKPLLMGIAIDSPIAFKISGDHINELRRISHEMQSILIKDKGILSTRDNFGVNALAYKVEIDEEKALRIGISRVDIALALITSTNGFPVTTWRAFDDPINVVLKLDKNDKKNPDDILNMYVRSQATGGSVPLSTFAVLKPLWEVGKIHRSKNRRAIIVHGYTKPGVLANDVIKRVMPAIKQVKMPSNYKFEIEGEEKERTKTFGDLTKVFAITIFALFFVLVFQFGTFMRAIVVLGSVPLALIGGVVGLYITNNSFGFTAFLGIIALAGIVIKNAVVWVEFVETSVKNGMKYKKAVIQAGLARLRPILLTAVTTIGGLIPLGMWGGVMWAPMAWTMIFGLGLSTVLTLIVIPVFYYKLVKPKVSAKVV